MPSISRPSVSVIYSWRKPASGFGHMLRLELAIASYAAGKNLTEASYAGGFADSAHFSCTFKRMFGVLAGGISVQRFQRV